MAILTWDEKYSVGIAEIDGQHKRLIQMINDLHEALVAAHGRQKLGEILAQMLDYAAYHFTAEESLMVTHGYPLYGAHKREHEGFTAKALELKQRVDAKGFVLTLEVLQFLKDWLSHHILVNDLKYAPFLRGAGVS